MIDPKQIAKQMSDYSLSYEDLGVWSAGGEDVKKVVPYGYAGNPANFESYIDTMEKLYDFMCKYIAEQM